MNATPETSIELGPTELREWLEQDAIQLIDVRASREFEAGHLAGSANVEFDEISGQAGEFGKDRKLVFVCRSGNRSEMIAEAFRTGGFDAYHLTGGLLAWAEEGMPLEPADGEVVERSVADL